MADQGWGHIPVLTQALLEQLQVQPGQVVMDATVGLGGHAVALLGELGPRGRLIGIDRDESNLAKARDRLSAAGDRVDLHHASISEIESVLDELRLPGVDVILADLGVSTTQLETPDRGFSFLSDGPLDMRMNTQQKTTAEALVNRLPENELADLLYYNSQERLSRRIAKRICRVRREGRIKTTQELVQIICDALGIKDPLSRASKIHPATRTFQALRMAVNQEMEELGSLLNLAPRRLNPGGKIAVISFHSVEDGAVKRDFRERKNAGIYRILTKKPLIADASERQANPQSRSAKLRVAERTEIAMA
jgi:16S rRNA (cytosine1402-N4)-methyltransferase